jgi:hypothetical protein
MEFASLRHWETALTNLVLMTPANATASAGVFFMSKHVPAQNSALDVYSNRRERKVASQGRCSALTSKLSNALLGAQRFRTDRSKR